MRKSEDISDLLLQSIGNATICSLAELNLSKRFLSVFLSVAREVQLTFPTLHLHSKLFKSICEIFRIREKKQNETF